VIFFNKVCHFSHLIYFGFYFFPSVNSTNFSNFWGKKTPNNSGYQNIIIIIIIIISPEGRGAGGEREMRESRERMKIG
jgi:hypothetical protein